MNAIIVCEFCKLICKTKYSLTAHLSRSKKCLKIRGLSLDNTFECKGCEFVFATRINLNVHEESCKDYAILLIKEEYDKKIDLLKEESDKKIDLLKEELKTTKQSQFKETIMLTEQYEKNLSDMRQKYEKEMSDTKHFHEKEKAFLEQQLNRVQTSYESITTSIAKEATSIAKEATKEAINKPTTTNNTINNIRNVLSSKYTIDDLDYDQLMLVFKKTLTEDVLLGGQPAIAKICSESIVQTNDSKMLICCTDTSRDKFKYMDVSGNVKEDFQARHFTSKIIKPLEAVGQEVYDTACTNISEEQTALESTQSPQYGRMAFLRNKEERLALSLMELRGIDRPDYNSKFVNELAVLTKS